MPTVPEAEARRLLARQLTCEGVTDWLPRNNGQTLQIQTGLIDEAGMKTDLFVKLSFKPGLRTSDARYTFSVFRMNSYGLDRVYQLCVSRASKRETDAHRKPHEHLGSLRSVGSAAWQKWGVRGSFGPVLRSDENSVHARAPRSEANQQRMELP